MTSLGPIMSESSLTRSTHPHYRMYRTNYHSPQEFNYNTLTNITNSNKVVPKFFFFYNSFYTKYKLELVCSKLLYKNESQASTVATPEPGPTRLASLNRNLGDARLILFIYILLRFLFQKSRDPNPWLDRRADPNRSPVYSNVFNYLIKTFSLCYLSLGFRFTRKQFQMVGPQTFTFHKIHV